VLAGVGDTLVHGVANVDPIVKEPIENALIEQVAVPVSRAGYDQFPRQERCRLKLDEPFEDRPDPLGVSWLDDELA
jgi:hypothetical protein